MKIPIPPPKAQAPGDPALNPVREGEMDLESGAKEVMYIDGAQLFSVLVEIATNAWKARTRLAGSGQSEQQPPEFRRLERNIEAIIDSLAKFEIKAQDHTGEAFDFGLPIKVVASQPQPGIARDVVTETIRPTVTFRGKILQRGEVVIATPASEEG